MRLIRVGALLVSGVAIAFTATLHHHLGFDRAVLGAALALLGVAHLLEWFGSGRGTSRSVRLLLGIAAFAGAAGAVVATTPIVFALVLAAWALASGLLEFIGGALRAGSRQDASLMGAVGVLLAVLVLLFRDDPIATLGLFGAYAFIGGVFLGISAFDSRALPDAPPSRSATR